MEGGHRPGVAEAEGHELPGLVLGPVIVGAVVTGTADGWFAATNGYAAMWPVIGIPVLLSLPILSRLRRAQLEEGAPARSVG